MLDKGILILTFVFQGANGMETMSVPAKDFRAFSAPDCIVQMEKENADWKLLVEAKKGQVDEKGRELVMATAQCYPVSGEEFAIFTSTFRVPD